MKIKSDNTKSISFFDKFLNIVEKGGNALPNPSTLFAIFALLTLVVSAITAQFDLQVIHPVTKEIIEVNNLFSESGDKKNNVRDGNELYKFCPNGNCAGSINGIRRCRGKWIN